ncbi:MAG: transposase [Clostridia bacterium]|nr:transposase [Clostridia bacterium]
MPRFPRNYINSEYFHVITQGINKSYIFDNSDDIKFYIKKIYSIQKDYNITIVAYCIMNNHAHMLINVNDLKNLSKFMHRLNTCYGKYYNSKYNRVGYVFRDRYKAEGIYSQNHLYNCIRYIYNNPVKAGICKNPQDYPFSNYKSVKCKDDENFVFIDTEEDREIIYKDYINTFLAKNNIELKDLMDNLNLLKELVKTLHFSFNVSLRKISQNLYIHRLTLSKLLK